MNLSNLLSDYKNIISERFEKSFRHKVMTNYEDVAFFNACSRVISCLVNERLVTSNLIRLRKNGNSFWVVVHNHQSNIEFKIWMPIVNKITVKNINYDIGSGIVRFLNPGDLGLIILFTKIENQLIKCGKVTEISQIFGMLVDAENESVISNIVHEINNSIKHQVLAYKECPSFKPLWRRPIEYEQAITVGHATHPMNKSRVPMPEMKSNAEFYNFKKIKIYFYKVLRSSMNIYGNYEQAIQVVAKKLNIFYNADTEIIIPVHELQRDVINDHFSDLQLQEISFTTALSECSLRTVNIDGITDCTFKLALGLTISSSMRTITHWSVFAGPAIGTIIQNILESNKYLTFLNELGSIIVKNEDSNKSKHFACIIRENVNVKLSDPLETAIVCAYLTEMSDGEYNISKLFGLNSQLDKETFSDLYAKLLIDSFFDFVYKFGFSFEAHQQNVLLKVRKNPEHGFELTGFIVRDFGGIKVHQETLHSKIGKTVSVLDNYASILADSLEDVYTLCYHTLFHCHLQQIFRSLGTHENGRGWRFVRKHLKTKTEFLECESCVNFFFAESAPYKSFIKMKLHHFERKYLYSDVPNVIHFNRM